MPVFNPYTVARRYQCQRRRNRASIRSGNCKEEHMSTEKRVNIGMIGAGWWANTMHMPALAACDQANVVAVCDLISERAETLAKKYHIPHTFTDYKELLAGCMRFAKSHSLSTTPRRPKWQPQPSKKA